MKKQSIKNDAGGEQVEMSFESALERLEAIVSEMEAGKTGLETMIQRFEEGQKLIAVCTKRLNEVERRIEILTKKGDSIEAQPFDVEDAGEESNGAPSKDKEDSDLF